MMIRPAELAAIQRGEIDLAFRRWDRPRVVLGTKLRTRVGLIEVTSVEPIESGAITEQDARRAGATDRAELLARLGSDQRPIHRVGLRHAGPDPRIALRESVPDAAELDVLCARLDRLDRSSPIGPWTRATLELIDRHPEVRAPELAADVGRETADFKKDVRKLKELGLTQSLDIGYRISPRGAALIDHLAGARRARPARPEGTDLPSIGAPATRALRAAGLTTLEAVVTRPRAELAALHGVGPVALERLDEALRAAELTGAWFEG